MQSRDLVLNLSAHNKDGEQNGGVTLDLPTEPTQLARIYHNLKANQVPPIQYQTLLRQFWISCAAKNAGINLNAWDPQKGVQENRNNINRIYTYYGKLFLSDPTKYQWAGMANMVGPSFIAAFLDLDVMRQLAHFCIGPISFILGLAFGGIPPLWLKQLAHFSNQQISWLENKLLSMQKHIFFDQGAMHEAYLNKGMAGIREMYEAGLFDADLSQDFNVPDIALQTLNAWQDIDSNDTQKIKNGNAVLLFREQMLIIHQQYRDIYTHDTLLSPLITYLMTMVSSASVPGTRNPTVYHPLSCGMTLPVISSITHKKIIINTPFPNFDITNSVDRWDYIVNDTLPIYQKMLNENRIVAQQIIATPIQKRVKQQRLFWRVPGLMSDLWRNWKITFTDTDKNVVSHKKSNVKESRNMNTRDEGLNLLSEMGINAELIDFLYKYDTRCYGKFTTEKLNDKSLEQVFMNSSCYCVAYIRVVNNEENSLYFAAKYFNGTDHYILEKMKCHDETLKKMDHELLEKNRFNCYELFVLTQSQFKKITNIFGPHDILGHYLKSILFTLKDMPVSLLKKILSLSENPSEVHLYHADGYDDETPNPRKLGIENINKLLDMNYSLCHVSIQGGVPDEIKDEYKQIENKLRRNQEIKKRITENFIPILQGRYQSQSSFFRMPTTVCHSIFTQLLPRDCSEEAVMNAMKRSLTYTKK